MHPALPEAGPGRDQLRGWIAAMEAGLLERGAAVRLALLAALAAEHVLLIGPPGSAKSELARRLHGAFAQAPYFERLLTRFSTPEELFGPLSLKALEEDRYERLIEGYLPCAGMAFLDEVFKANSAILNSLLTLLNEREYDHGSGRIHTPLISVVGATNEVPADEALRAFFDRFLLRVQVLPVSDAAFCELLTLQAPCAPAPAPLTSAQRAAVLRARRGIVLPESVLQVLGQLRRWLAERSMPVSDRRWRQLAGLLQTQALTDGRASVDTVDLWLAPHVVCEDPAKADAVAQWFAHDVLGAVAQEAPWLTRAVQAFEQQLLQEQQADATEGDDLAGKLALARVVGGADTRTDMPRLRSSRLEAQLRKHFSLVHVAARVAQVDELAAQVAAGQAQAQAQLTALRSLLNDRLWLPPALAQTWLQAHESTLAVLAGLHQRTAALRAGFAALPQQDDDDQVSPAPVRWSESA